MRPRKLGVVRDGSLQLRDRFFVPAKRQQRDGTVVARAAERGVELDRPSVSSDRIVQPVSKLQRHTQVVVHGCGLRPNLECSPQLAYSASSS